MRLIQREKPLASNQKCMHNGTPVYRQRLYSLLSSSHHRLSSIPFTSLLTYTYLLPLIKDNLG